jgi:diguanylate cyclase (GGDEF)-like protein
MLCRGLATRDEAGHPHRLTGIQTDITDQKLAERQILKDAFRDALTGLPNRVLFLDRLERVAQSHLRYPNEYFAVLSIDLQPLLAGGVTADWDTLEPVLALAAQNLQKGLRQCDTLARIGRAEFAVLLGRIQDPADASSVLERLRRSAGCSYSFDDHEVFVSIQAGIAVADADTQNGQALFENAQTSKHSKQNIQPIRSVRKAPRDMDAKTLALVGDQLKEALLREDFRVQYLPWISLQTGRLVGFEALARWKRLSDDQLVGPDQFIVAAEKAALLPAIEAQIMSVACRKLHDWNKNFKKDPPLFVSVNICGAHFSTNGLLKSVQKSFALSNLPPETLWLECPEKDITQYIDQAAHIMDALTQKGVRWAVDDFDGNDGFLSVVPRLPVSCLKFNGDLFAQAHRDDDATRRARSMADRAKALGLQLAAKCIENKDQLELAKSWGFHYAQGFYISKPLDESAVWGLLSANPTW